MVEIAVKGQSLPTRCEICHQADCFDANNNHCSRCSVVSSGNRSSNYFSTIEEAETEKAVTLQQQLASLAGRIATAIVIFAGGFTIAYIVALISVVDTWLYTVGFIGGIVALLLCWLAEWTKDSNRLIDLAMPRLVIAGIARAILGAVVGAVFAVMLLIPGILVIGVFVSNPNTLDLICYLILISCMLTGAGIALSSMDRTNLKLKEKNKITFQSAPR